MRCTEGPVQLTFYFALKIGILPKERPKTLTVRDVKRQSEQRREREKIRKEIDELDSEGIWMLCVFDIVVRAFFIMHVVLRSGWMSCFVCINVFSSIIIKIDIWHQ